LCSIFRAKASQVGEAKTHRACQGVGGTGAVPRTGSASYRARYARPDAEATSQRHVRTYLCIGIQSISPGLNGLACGQSVVCRAHLVTTKEEVCCCFGWCSGVKLSSVSHSTSGGVEGRGLRRTRCACNASWLRVSSGAFVSSSDAHEAFVRAPVARCGLGGCSFWPGRGSNDYLSAWKGFVGCRGRRDALPLG
jgi:hypothetical protein